MKKQLVNVAKNNQVNVFVNFEEGIIDELVQWGVNREREREGDREREREKDTEENKEQEETNKFN